MRGSKFPADMMSYLHTKFHDNWISSFRGVAMTIFWDGQTDRVTALLDLLSPLATQVKTPQPWYKEEIAKKTPPKTTKT